MNHNYKGVRNMKSVAIALIAILASMSFVMAGLGPYPHQIAATNVVAIDNDIPTIEPEQTSTGRGSGHRETPETCEARVKKDLGIVYMDEKSILIDMSGRTSSDVYTEYMAMLKNAKRNPCIFSVWDQLKHFSF